MPFHWNAYGNANFYTDCDYTSVADAHGYSYGYGATEPYANGHIHDHAKCYCDSYSYSYFETNAYCQAERDAEVASYTGAAPELLMGTSREN